jgi:hypothetical protein
MRQIRTSGSMSGVGGDGSREGLGEQVDESLPTQSAPTFLQVPPADSTDVGQDAAVAAALAARPSSPAPGSTRFLSYLPSQRDACLFCLCMLREAASRIGNGASPRISFIALADG